VHQGVIEWKQSPNKSVAGVFNPQTKQVEWKTLWNGGVAGVWNPKTETIEWREK